MNTDHKLAYFTGTGLTATLETAEFQPMAGRRSFVNLVRPIFEGSGSTVTIQLTGRNVGTGSVSFSSAVSLNASGNAPVRQDARYHRARINISGGFDHAQGIDVTWKARGKR